MISTLLVLVLLEWLTDKLSRGVLDRPKACLTLTKGLDAIKHGWLDYMNLPVLPANLAYVLLCFNVFLTPGGLMTSLTSEVAGAAGLFFQATLLTVAVARQTPTPFFLCLIVISRLGHMSYDVVGAKILQTGIPASTADLIGTTEVSMQSLAELMMLDLVIIAKDVSHFVLLAMLSSLLITNFELNYLKGCHRIAALHTTIDSAFDWRPGCNYHR